MKLSRIYCAVMLFLFAGISSCNEEDDLYPQLGDDPRNLTQIINEDANLSALAQALSQVGLDSTLSTTSTYTLFAPNNAALADVDMSTLSEEELTNFLMNHVLSTTTADFSSTLTTGYMPTMATGPDDTNLSLFINTDGALKLNGIASPVQGSFDIGSTNGVLHVVDNVLVPPTVLDHTKANPNFSTLAEAIELAGLSETLGVTDPELETYPFTVFAPTNAAFENLMMQLNGAFGWSSLNDVPTEILQEILMYHVVGGANTLSETIGGTEQATLQGNSFSINDDAVITDGSYTTANFTTTDIQGINGVVHGTNKVLLPESIFQQILDATLNLKERSEDRGFTLFLAAMEKTGLTNLLEGEEMLTIFAPNNEAFEGLFTAIENFESLDDFDTEEEINVLRSLLNYHIHEGVLMSSQLTNGGTITTLNGDPITADLSGDNARLRPSYEAGLPSTIVIANIGAMNGIIHEINRVLVPAGLDTILGFATDEGGTCPVADESLVFFDWNGKNPYWGNVQPEDGSLSLDGTSYGRANFQTGGTGFIDLFWRNDPATFNGAQVVGDNLEGYSIKFDINIVEPISAGRFRLRFNALTGEDVFYDWAPWEDTGEPFTTDGWETIEIPLTELGVPDFSIVDAEFGMAFQDADVLLNFAIDNVRFDVPGCGGPEPVADTESVFFDWDGKDPYWGNVTVENDAAISLDGSNYGRANFQTGGTGFTDLFWRNDASTFYGANVVGSNLDDYVLKFEILTFEPISEGRFRLRFNSTTNGVDAFYDWAPWQETGEPFDTEGEWVTITIPVSELGQPDFSQVNAEFGMAFQDADILLNFAIDNVRFEEK